MIRTVRRVAFVSALALLVVPVVGFSAGTTSPESPSFEGPSVSSDGLTVERIAALDRVAASISAGVIPDDCNICWNAKNGSSRQHVFERNSTAPTPPSGYTLIEEDDPNIGETPSEYFVEASYPETVDDHDSWMTGNCASAHSSCAPDGLREAIASASDGDVTDLATYLAENGKRVRLAEGGAFVMWACPSASGLIPLNVDAWKSLKDK